MHPFLLTKQTEQSALEQIQIKGPYLDQRLPQYENLYPVGLKSARIETTQILLSKKVPNV